VGLYDIKEVKATLIIEKFKDAGIYIKEPRLAYELFLKFNDEIDTLYTVCITLLGRFNNAMRMEMYVDDEDGFDSACFCGEFFAEKYPDDLLETIYKELEQFDDTFSTMRSWMYFTSSFNTYTSNTLTERFEKEIYPLSEAEQTNKLSELFYFFEGYIKDSSFKSIDYCLFFLDTNKLSDLIKIQILYLISHYRKELKQWTYFRDKIYCELAMQGKNADELLVGFMEE